ncbi:hypothetical protein [Methylobacterium sp. WSM2598]|uniref:hypothetical protein n=1 Tax=Methylobacterium sp. WSM2598 TaxID=398261 RepID=UPI0003619455|nr:hypothetical protein [Methylobacterium sp. WSM2598]
MSNGNAVAAMPFAVLAKTVADTVAEPAKVSPPLRRTLMINEAVSRSAANALGTVQVLAMRPDPDTLGDLFDMQAALLERFRQLDRAWIDGLTQLAQARLALREANTISKVMEQEFNLLGQFGTLVANQITNTAALLESVNVGYAYWLSRKIGAPQSPQT